MPDRTHRLPAVAALAALAAAAAIDATVVGEAGAGETVAVAVVNASRPTDCAEEDNVDVRLVRPGIAGLRISAEPPPYLGPDVIDRTDPDFTHCDMRGDPVFAARPRTVTLADGGGIRLVGHAFAGFWRPADVPVRVAGEAGGAGTAADVREEAGLHLLQVIDTRGPRPVEVLVVYPPDGYWRAKPLPPADRADTGYGSSFLVGPVVSEGRPLVRLRSLAFDPRTLTFTLAFAEGGEATLSIVERSPAATRLAVRFAPPLTGGAAFAALRSMYVAADNADVAVTAWQPAAAAAWSAQPVMAPLRVEATAVRFGRTAPSRHNTSAPDMLFDGFALAAD
jgi:hypothetical protein